jgi:hypothetical protein
VPKFTSTERAQIQNIVANLSIKRIPESEIIKEIETQTHKTITKRSLHYIKWRIKKESKHWYETLREGEYEYIHEFKQRISEIVDLQRRHYKIIEDNANSPTIQQASLTELHKLNITLSNYFDVAPTIATVANPVTKENDNTISVSQQNKDIIV